MHADQLLIRAGALLAESLNYEAMLRQVAQLVVPHLADWCAVHFVDAGGQATRLVVTHVDPAKAAWARELQERYPPRAGEGVDHVLRTGRTERYAEIPDAMLATLAHDDEHLALLRAVGFTSAMVIPLVARGRTLGALTLVTAESGRRYGADDQRLAEELASRCALSIDNALLHRDVQAAEARYRALFEGSPDGKLVLDANGRYVDANPALERLTGYSRAELLGMKAGDLAADHARPPAAFAELRHGPVGLETSVRRKDGTHVPVESRATAVPLPGETIYMAVLRDISERKAAEAEIRALNESLERRVLERTAELSAVNKELEAFTYSVSHDLRAPLRIVDGFSKILLEDYSEQLPEEAVRTVGIVRDGAAKMGRLIDDLLQFSRLGRQSLRPRDVSPAEIVSAVLDELRGELDGRSIDWSIGALPICRADPALLKQVFVNLLSNALKYTRGREPARITVGALPWDDSSTEQTYFVRDNGVGFDMAYVHKLFGVFQRLHRVEDYEGTGVGLALTQRIIHRHGGRIWAEAEVEHGATFWFSLPAAAGDESVANPAID
jgi:PAS domain S-box-containing protein